MISQSAKVFLVVTAATCISGCQIMGVPQDGSPFGLRTQKFSLPCPQSMNIVGVFKVEIRDNMHLASAEKRAFTHAAGVDPKGEKDDDIKTPVVSVDPQNATTYNNNPFHIDLTNYYFSPAKTSKPKTSPSTGPDYFKIRVVLTGSDYKFYESQPGDSIQGLHGIGYSEVDLNHAGDFCTDGIHLPDGSGFKYPTAILYVKKNTGGKATYQEGYNILVSPINGDNTPIIIDPKLENNG